MKSQVLHTVLCNVAEAEAAREIWNWSLLGVKFTDVVSLYKELPYVWVVFPWNSLSISLFFL